MADKKQPWDFRAIDTGAHQESAASFKAFKVYLELGRDRNHQTIADVTGSPVTSVATWATRFKWQERAVLYDVHMVEKWSVEVRDEFESRHKTELMKFRKDQQRRAEKLGKVADLLIEVTTGTLEDMVQSAEPVDRAQLAAIANTAAKLSDAAMNTAAAALGVDDLMEAIAPDVE